MRALADLAVECFRKIPNLGAVSSRVGNACVRVLGEMTGHEPVAQLGRLRTRVKYAVGVNLIERALDEAARREGISRTELEELAVPTFDLDATGARVVILGDAIAEIRIAGSDEVTLSWRTTDGRSLKSAPASVRDGHAAALAQVKRTVKALLALLPAQRARLEQQLLDDRTIPLEAWRARYVDHPLVGQMARRLIWEFSDGSRVVLGAMEAGQILDVDDRPLSWLTSTTGVRLWHPIGHPRDVVDAWRRWLDRHAMMQPFKQAHREVYTVALGDETTRTYSSRFAAHILHQHRFAALCRERGWSYRLQGTWDSSNDAACELPRWQLRVTLEIERPPDLATVESGVFEFVHTGHVTFWRDHVRIPLTEVPSLAFSEAMRDVDLFVSVCSASYDAAWIDRAPSPTFHEYWLRLLGSPLSESAAIRQSVLEELIPHLQIGGQLTLEDGFLVVRGGHDRTYRIHLASANVVREPGSEFLCLAPEPRRKPTDRARHPFEGDLLLITILDRAFRLADDKNLRDALILPLPRP